MIGNEQGTVSAPMIKIVTTWGAVAITSWSDVAAMLASVYTLILIGEWLWKKSLRPFMERHGFIKRLARRKDD